MSLPLGTGFLVCKMGVPELRAGLELDLSPWFWHPGPECVAETGMQQVPSEGWVSPGLMPASPP